MALGIKCLRLLHPAFCSYLTTLTRPASEISMKPVHGRQHEQRQYLAYQAMPVRQFATKKAKAKGKGQPQARVNINTALVEDIINLEEVDEEMKSVMEALKDNFNKTLNIRTAPGSLDHITVVTADGKLALNHIGQISMKSPQLILVNMASFPECTAAAIKAIRESGMNLNPEVEGTLIRVPIPKSARWPTTQSQSWTGTWQQRPKNSLDESQQSLSGHPLGDQLTPATPLFIHRRLSLLLHREAH
uniref:ribosome-recycling factor, mitochondrial isoform X2 n=1 Tax=Myodes glareolus TaxID=447135 RepID=UPI00201FED66|nr:ribosome-recycling factor, mitochondrial isoform X2 [Myodes glareolus]